MATWLPESEQRWFRALLVLGTFSVGLIFVGQVATIAVYFSDILLILAMAWVFAFILSPIVAGILRAFPTLPRALVVVLVYTILFVVVIIAFVLVAGTLLTSIQGFIGNLPQFQRNLPSILAPWQRSLDSLGFQINLNDLASQGLQSIGNLSGTLVKPLTDLAVASLGMLGNLMMVVFMSLFIVIDKDRMVAFLNRLVPPRWSDEANLFENSVAQSFGGFLRGQAIQGLVYGVIAAAGSIVLGLDYLPATSAAVAILQMIPFFGPFFSWAPPVVVAVLIKPDAVVPIIAVMAVGWFVVMNIVSPRVMARSVHIHPVVVLVSVLIGLKLQGMIGAIFAIPVAAVISSFFFFYLKRSAGEPHDVATRAAMRVGQREGRAVRVPSAPSVSNPGSGDADFNLSPSADGSGASGPDADGARVLRTRRSRGDGADRGPSSGEEAIRAGKGESESDLGGGRVPSAGEETVPAGDGEDEGETHGEADVAAATATDAAEAVGAPGLRIRGAPGAARTRARP